MAENRNARYDVVVVGGGAAGLGAAVAAARTGAKVLLLERYGFLGGAAANSLVLAYCGFYQKGPHPVAAVRGVGEELLGVLAGIGQDVSPVMSRSGNWIVLLDPEAVKFAFDQLAEKAGVSVLMHSRMTGAAVDAGRVASVTVTDHAGSYEISAGAFVDASGEATLSALAGVEMTVDSLEGSHVQPASMPVRIGGVGPGVEFDRGRMAELIAAHNAGSDIQIPRDDGGVMFRLPVSGDYWWMTIDLATGGLTGTDLGAAERRARAEAWRNLALLRQLPGFGNAYIAATGPQIGIRETRRPRSIEDLTGAALEQGLRRPDGVGRAAWPMEVHEAPGKARFVEIGGNGFADIPPGALRAFGVGNLFLAGRVAGADIAAYGSLRVMGTAFATGQAAGVMAALFERSPAGTDTIRRELAAQNALV